MGKEGKSNFLINNFPLKLSRLSARAVGHVYKFLSFSISLHQLRANFVIIFKTDFQNEKGEQNRLGSMRFNQAATKVMKKRLWNMLRIALLTIRRSDLLKHRLSEDFHVAIKRGKDLGKNLRSLIFHHHHHTYRLNSLGEYEFPCSNSPAGPAAFDFRKRERHHHFSVLGRQMPCEDISLDESVAIVSDNFIQMEYSSGEYGAIQATKNGLGSSDGEDESEQQVDREAEEFIGRFHAQMKLQRQISMLNYQEMLARGAN